jgi:hypothetical protein
MADSVVRPQHYQAGGIETIDVIRAKLGPVGFGYYCEGNTIKYLTRWRHKGGVEDLRKARVYLEWLLVEAQLQEPQTVELAEGVLAHVIDAPMPPIAEVMLSMAEEGDDEPGHLKAGEAYAAVGEPMFVPIESLGREA